MGYLTRKGQWADTEDVTFFAMGPHPSGPTEPLELGDRLMLRLTLAIAKVVGESGSGLTMGIETAETKDGPWRSAGAFLLHGAPMRDRASFVGLDRWVRANPDVKGEVHFSLDGEAV